MKTAKALRREAVLKYLVEHLGQPIAAGENYTKRGSVVRFHAKTLQSMEDDGVLQGRIGNDGARWYFAKEGR
jgi:hypothetical protein